MKKIFAVLISVIILLIQLQISASASTMLTSASVCGENIVATELDGHVILSSEKSASVTPYVSDYTANITINGIYAIEEEPLNIALNTGVNKVNLTVANGSLSETYNFYIVYATGTINVSSPSVEKTGLWAPSINKGENGSNTFYNVITDVANAEDGKSIHFPIEEIGLMELFIYKPDGNSSNPSGASLKVSAGGKTTDVTDIFFSGECGSWINLGTYYFAADSTDGLSIVAGTNYIFVNSIKLVHTKDTIISKPKITIENNTISGEMTYYKKSVGYPALTLIIAVYDTEGRLSDIASTFGNQYEGGVFDLATETIPISSGYTYKVFLWDSFLNIIPINAILY